MAQHEFVLTAAQVGFVDAAEPRVSVFVWLAFWRRTLSRGKKFESKIVEIEVSTSVICLLYQTSVHPAICAESIFDIINLD